MLKKIVKKILRIKSPLDIYSYSIDLVSEKEIAGWAYRKNEDNYVPTIEVRSAEILLWSTKANVFREDLKESHIGTGKYGFSIAPKLPAGDKGIASVDIFIDGLKANRRAIPLKLSASSKPNACISAPNVIETTKQKPTNLVANHQYYLDSISPEKITGWVRRKDSVKHRCIVELKDGDIVLGCDKADKFRQSIRNAGIGDGYYCFEIKPSLELFPSTTVTCQLVVDGEPVQTTEIKLNVSESKIQQAKFAKDFENEIIDFKRAYELEITRLDNHVKFSNESGGGCLSVAMENIASLSVRIGVIEQILSKHFTSK